MHAALIENNLILNLNFSKVIRLYEYIVEVFPEIIVFFFNQKVAHW